jgi:signal recognition particle receptor subunit beta
VRSSDYSYPLGPDRGRIRSAKIVIAGGFGVGKTTMVGAVSEIEPLTTEAVMTSAGTDHDDLSGVPDKTTTTVAMDFGRITVGPDLILYLFGAPGQTRFWFMPSCSPTCAACPTASRRSTSLRIVGCPTWLR